MPVIYTSDFVKGFICDIGGFHFMSRWFTPVPTPGTALRKYEMVAKYPLICRFFTACLLIAGAKFAVEKDKSFTIKKSNNANNRQNHYYGEKYRGSPH